MYCKNALEVWMTNWVKNAVGGKWRNSKSKLLYLFFVYFKQISFLEKSVPHQEIFQRIKLAMDVNQISIEYVKAHNGEAGNEKADQLAVEGAHMHERIRARI